MATIGEDKHSSSYDIVKVEEKAPIPTSYLSNALTAVGTANDTCYLVLLIANIFKAKAQGDQSLLTPSLFAASQVLEHSKKPQLYTTDHS